jgi:hypothetical protein
MVKKATDDRRDDDDEPRRESRDSSINPLAEPAPGWSNSTDTGPQFPTVSPGVDMSIPGFSNNGPAATGATAGIPGAWTPANADPPNKFQNMNSITASPATAWTSGQYVKLGDGSNAFWGGAAWTSGIKP